MQQKNKKKHTVIQYIPYSYHRHSGGVEKISQTISDGLNAGGEIDIYTVASDIGINRDIYDDTCFVPSFEIVHNFPFPKVWTKAFWHHLGEIKKRKPDTIITHTRFFVQSMIGGLVSKWLGCRWIHVEHGSGFVTGYPLYIKLCAGLFDRTVGVWIFRQCDEIITISQMHKQFIKKFTKKEPVVIYNPVEKPMNGTNPSQSSLYQGRCNDGQSKGSKHHIHIGFVGRLVPLKGVDLLIQALANLTDYKRTCTIVGTGSQDQILKDLAQTLCVSDNISFVGPDDRANWLPQWDILVNPSHQEGVPTTVIEGLMCGCIVVATDVGGTREISDQEDLILCRPGDIYDLHTKIQLAYTRLDHSGASRDIVNARFGVEGVLEKYRDCILR